MEQLLAKLSFMWVIAIFLVILISVQMTIYTIREPEQVLLIYQKKKKKTSVTQRKNKKAEYSACYIYIYISI